MALIGCVGSLYDKQSVLEYDIVAPGFKYNMPDVAAAIGLAQLERTESLRNERERCACYYYNRLSGLDCIDLPLLHVPMADHAWHIFHIILKEDHLFPGINLSK